MEKRNTLNSIYKPVVTAAEQIKKQMETTYENVSLGFYNNHFHKNDAGEYTADYFPIPVITVENICDIEFDIDFVSVTSKMSKADAIYFDFNKIEKYKFEIYGVNNYLEDYYTPDDSILNILSNIKSSRENEFFFTFYFDTDTAHKKLYQLINCLSENKFYY